MSFKMFTLLKHGYSIWNCHICISHVSCTDTCSIRIENFCIFLFYFSNISYIRVKYTIDTKIIEYANIILFNCVKVKNWDYFCYIDIPM